MEHTKELLSIDLSMLVPSPRNVRRHSVGQVEELAALIDAQGLLHNLVVTEQVVGRGRARKVKFAVAAGERRRRALLLLQQRGRLPKGHEVLCELVPPERALEVSLAENSGREAMHPADEFEAFKALIDEGKGIEDVAARFGVAPLTVQRRLKLSALSPKLLALHRQDGINLDQLMALALSDGHAVQEHAWFDAPPWGRDPAAIRRKLTAGEVEAATSALARFVGIDAYEAAGGVVRRDLFDDEQSRFLSDPALLDRLAMEMLEAHAVAIREDAAEGWKWVEVRLTLDHQAQRQFMPCEHTTRRPTAEESAALAELTQREEELAAEEQLLPNSYAAAGDDWERIGLEQEEIEARRKAIQMGLRTWTEADRRRVGVIVTVNRTGDLEVIRGRCGRMTARRGPSAGLLQRTVAATERSRAVPPVPPAPAARPRPNRPAPPCRKACRGGSRRTGPWPCRLCCCNARPSRWPCWPMSSCSAPSVTATAVRVRWRRSRHSSLRVR